MNITKYQVLYTKDGAKKRKLFSDGYLIVKDGSNNARAVSLTSDDNTEVWRTSGKIMASYEVGNEITLGSYLIQIDSIVSEGVESSTTKKPSPVHAPTLPSLKQAKFVAPSRLIPFKPKTMVAKDESNIVYSQNINENDNDVFWNQENLTSSPPPVSSTAQINSNVQIESKQFLENNAKPINLNNSATRFPVYNQPNSKNSGNISRMKTSGPVTILPEQDPSLTRLMRPHQIIGADFIIARLLGKPCSDSEETHSSGSDSSVQDNICTGAILADEVCNICNISV